MDLVLAHSVDTGRLIAGGSVVVLCILGIWMLILGAQRSVGWFLALFFISITQFIFIFVEPKAMRVFIMQLAVSAVGFWGIYGVDIKEGDSSFWRKLDLVVGEKVHRVELEPSSEDASPPASLEDRKVHLREWQTRLETQKKNLDPNDAAAKAAFDKEYQQYMLELQKVKAEMAAPAH